MEWIGISSPVAGWVDQRFSSHQCLSNETIGGLNRQSYVENVKNFNQFVAVKFKSRSNEMLSSYFLQLMAKNTLKKTEARGEIPQYFFVINPPNKF